MAVLGRVLISSAERLDLPDLQSIDSFVAGDFKYLLQSLIGTDKPLILAGFDILNPELSIGTQSISIKVFDSTVFYPTSNSGSFFVGLPEGNELSQALVPELRTGAPGIPTVNYVYLTFTTTETTKDTRAFWDPDKDGGQGGEFTQDVNTESVLSVDVNVSISGFPDGVIPIAKISVEDNIKSIQDCRDLMFRLGSGGTEPDAFNRYNFRAEPQNGFEREEPSTVMAVATDPNPFFGADKNFRTLKEWMDVVMTKFAELSGTTFWYQEAVNLNLTDIFNDALASSIKSKGQWNHDAVTAGQISWTEDLFLKNVRDPRDIIVRNDSKTLTNEEVLFIDLSRGSSFNTLSEPVTWPAQADANPDIVNGILGSFESLAKGDWAKARNHDNTFFLRVEEFYAGPGGTGGVTTANLAQSILLNDVYKGGASTEEGIFSKGVFQGSGLQTAFRDDPIFETIGGNLFWLVMRSDTVMNLDTITPTTISVDITEADGVTAKCTSVGHGLQDGDRITFDGSTNYDATYKVEVETTDVFYIDTAGTVDEASVPGYYAIATTTSRTSDQETTPSIGGSYSGIEVESANHGFDDDQKIILEDTTTGYDSTYEIKVRTQTEFQIAIPASLAGTSVTVGFAKLIKMFVKTESGVDRVIRGEVRDIGGIETENIRDFIGMPTISSMPFYSVSPSYDTLDGQANYNTVQGENLTERVSKITSMMADKVQDKTVQFLHGGYDRITNTTNAANQELSFSSIIGETPLMTFVLPNSEEKNFLQLSGSIALATGQTAYLSVDRNNLQNIAGLGSLTVVNHEDVPLNENIFIFCTRLADDSLYLWNGNRVLKDEIIASEEHQEELNRQDRNLQLVKGGNWNLYPTSTVNLLSQVVDNNSLSLSTSGVQYSQAVNYATADAGVESMFVKLRRVGLVVGSMSLEIQTDNGGGLPSGLVIARSETVDISTLSTSATNQEFFFSNTPYLDSTDTYYFVVRIHKDTSLKSGTGLFLHTDSTGGSGGLKQKIAGTWSTVATTDAVHQLDGDSSLNLSWDEDAHIQSPDLLATRNTIQAGSVDFTEDGQVAYVELTRWQNAAVVNLTPVIAKIEDVDPTLDTYIFARREDGTVHVGDDRFSLNEIRELNASISENLSEFLGDKASEPTSISERNTNYITRKDELRPDGHGLRIVDNDDGLADAISSMDAEIDKFFSGFRIVAHPNDPQRVIIRGSDYSMKDNTKISKEMHGKLISFDGAEIDFQNGIVYASNGTSPLEITFTPPTTIVANNYKWCSITLMKGEIDTSSNKRKLSIFVGISPDEHIFADNAASADFGQNGIPLGQVGLQVDTGTVQPITQDNVVQIFGTGGDSTPEHIEQGDEAVKSPAAGFLMRVFDVLDCPNTDPDSKVDSTRTNAYYDPRVSSYKMECDASKTCITTGTAFTLSGVSTYTVQVNDVIYSPLNGEWRRITNVAGNQTGTLDSAFTIDLASTAVMVSQAVYSKDMVNVGDASQGTRPRDVYNNEEITVCNIDYGYSLSDKDKFPDMVDQATIVVSASNQGLQADVGTTGSSTFGDAHEKLPLPGQLLNYYPKINTNQERMFLVFFCNIDNPSVTATANLHQFDVSFYEDPFNVDFLKTGFLDSAWCLSDASGVINNCQQPTVFGGVTRLELDYQYNPGTNPLESDGDLEVYLDGNAIPRFFTGVTGAYWKEVPGSRTKLDFHTDLSGSALSVLVRRRQGAIDNSDDNALQIINIKSILSEAIVGSAMDVTNGLATHTSIQQAHDDVIIGGKIIVRSLTFTENVIITKDVFIEGRGRSTILSGTLDVNGNFSLIKYIKVTGTITYGAASNSNNTTDCWQAAAQAIVDNGTNNEITIIQE